MVSPLYWLLMSELFPMHVRGALTGLSVSAQWLFNATVAFLFPVLLHAIGPGTFFAFAVINAISLAVVARFLPETKGRTLEQLETYLKNHFSDEEGASGRKESLLNIAADKNAMLEHKVV